MILMRHRPPHRGRAAVHAPWTLLVGLAVGEPHATQSVQNDHVVFTPNHYRESRALWYGGLSRARVSRLCIPLSLSVYPERAESLSSRLYRVCVLCLSLAGSLRTRSLFSLSVSQLSVVVRVESAREQRSPRARAAARAHVCAACTSRQLWRFCFIHVCVRA